MRQPGRLTAAGLPVRWVAFDEVHGHSEELRKKAAKAGLSYVAIIPCAYQVPLPSGAVIRADEAVADAVSERRSCGNDADLLIPLGDAPVPVRGGQPCPPGIGPTRLSTGETDRLAGLARQYAAGLISRARLAFALHWSVQRRRHQAIARWHHYSARLLAITGTG